jgi:hypothetical protein
MAMNRAASPSHQDALPTSAQTIERWLRRLGGAMLTLLLVQFFIGMLANLFIVLPDQHPGANAPEYFSGIVRGDWWALGFGGWELQLHVLAGLLLAVGSLAMLVLAIMLRHRLWIIVAALGWLGVFAAGFNGASFLNYGHDFSSLLMTIGFLVALIPYALGLYYTKPTS